MATIVAQTHPQTVFRIAFTPDGEQLTRVGEWEGEAWVQMGPDRRDKATQRELEAVREYADR